MSCDEKPTHCKHFVTRKKRYCRMTVKLGEEWCGEHKPNVNFDSLTAKESEEFNNGLEKYRITCPLDPKHTCYAHKLKQHLKKCNAKSTALPVYIQKDINSGNRVGEESEKKEKRLLSNVSVSELLQVISKVNKVHKDVIKVSIVEKILTHCILEKELSNSQYGYLAKKHLSQTSSILGIVKDLELFQPETCFVEFGAGKGKLSFWIGRILEDMQLDSSSVLLVERASHRHKHDNKLDKSTGRVVRIRADIADLSLEKVEIVTKAKHVVAVTKHLCGDATDLAMRCLINSKKSRKDVMGLVMAFCCHHRCRWLSYTGKAFFEEVGLTRSDFDAMCGMVSWAVCGTGRGRKQNSEINLGLNIKDEELGLKREEKEQIGKKCKDLLNWGRKMYLEKHAFKSSLCYYINSDVSLENVCIVAVNEHLL